MRPGSLKRVAGSFLLLGSASVSNYVGSGVVGLAFGGFAVSGVGLEPRIFAAKASVAAEGPLGRVPWPPWRHKRSARVLWSL